MYQELRSYIPDRSDVACVFENSNLEPGVGMPLGLRRSDLLARLDPTDSPVFLFTARF